MLTYAFLFFFLQYHMSSMHSLETVEQIFYFANLSL